ncbi:hypothetical protein EV643_102454 [Kribbella sp. VKM Ac-2527]|uniref:Uncharacterized protein n=1 Tax=Kribbella caucasensis TaxID=2512215 RepID=A0A4R6KPK0_9ACTN|nr:hypothetical protein [Kribbella sp. VKM Ac-2527]TDO52615.1 hypothetical protein EV643_102454 [Kribbella sp. VKM Ac-2527]
MKPYYCARNKHLLVQMVAVDGEPAVEARTVALTPAGIVINTTTFTAADLDDYSGLTTVVSCPCGQPESVDLVAFRRGEPVQRRRPLRRGSHGVSHDRRRKAL